ncbi:MAG: phosphoadenylyl-sulfate reductase [Ruegeria sp.]
MPLDLIQTELGRDRHGLTARVEELNARFRHHSAHDVLHGAMAEVEKLALVSSFGAESVVLLHMAAVIDKATPVLFIDTQMLFAETLEYQHGVSDRLGLTRVHIIRATPPDLQRSDPYGALRLRDADACCNLRKTFPLQHALSGYDGWITGRKRFQSGARSKINFFEVEDGTSRIKVNPLAHWAPEDVRAYMDENRLPKHPLVAKGYPSIGCEPCTSPVNTGEEPRAGRWRNEEKQECGIHFVDGKIMRVGEKI